MHPFWFLNSGKESKKMSEETETVTFKVARGVYSLAAPRVSVLFFKGWFWWLIVDEIPSSKRTSPVHLLDTCSLSSSFSLHVFFPLPLIWNKPQTSCLYQGHCKTAAARSDGKSPNANHIENCAWFKEHFKLIWDTIIILLLIIMVLG